MIPGVIHVDSRVGSRELAPILQKRYRLRVKLTVLDSADVAFLTDESFLNGQGPMTIGIERKTLGDLAGSLLKNRLGAHQIPKMLAQYDLCWLLVEGLWRPSADDMIETFIGGQWVGSRVSLTYSQLSGWLVRYDVMGGGKIRRWRTSNHGETAAFIASLARWCWKPWNKHQVQQIDKMQMPEKALFWRPLQIHRTAASLPEIGIKLAKKVARHFDSILEMMNASEQEWRRAGLGKKDAETVCAAIRRKYR